MSFSAKMVKRRHNALGFSIQLRKFVHNPAGDLESEVCANLASINSYTSRCASTIWLGAFLENRRKAEVRRRLTLKRFSVFTMMLGRPSRRGATSHHNRDGVKTAIRALKVGLSEYSKLWERY